LIRDQYHAESLSECHEIIIETKDSAAVCLNQIILTYGTKYQTISSSLFDNICALLKGDSKSYLLFYGPLKLISLQNIVTSKDCNFYLQVVEDLMEDQTLDLAFKDACIRVVKCIIHNVFHYYEVNQYHSTVTNEAVESFLKTANSMFPDLIHKSDSTLSIF
jgi:hypothetical protein